MKNDTFGENICDMKLIENYKKAKERRFRERCVKYATKITRENDDIRYVFFYIHNFIKNGDCNFNAKFFDKEA